MVWQGEERRKFPRATLSTSIVIVTLPLKPQLLGSRILVSHIEDIGKGGVRIVLEEELKPFTKVDLTLLFGKERVIECKGKVVWAAKKEYPIEGKSLIKVEPLTFDTGVEFTEIDDSAKQYIRELVKTILAQEKKKNE